MPINEPLSTDGQCLAPVDGKWQCGFLAAAIVPIPLDRSTIESSFCLLDGHLRRLWNPSPDLRKIFGVRRMVLIGVDEYASPRFEVPRFGPPRTSRTGNQGNRIQHAQPSHDAFHNCIKVTARRRLWTWRLFRMKFGAFFRPHMQYICR